MWSTSAPCGSRLLWKLFLLALLLVLVMIEFVGALQSTSFLRPRWPAPGRNDEADLVALGRRVAGRGQRLVLCFLRAEQREEAVNFLAHVNVTGAGVAAPGQLGQAIAGALPGLMNALSPAPAPAGQGGGAGDSSDGGGGAGRASPAALSAAA